MAKVIGFYIPKNFRKPFEVGSSAAMWKGHRVLLADEGISLLGPGFELIQEKANEQYWIWATRDEHIRDFFLTG